MTRILKILCTEWPFPAAALMLWTAFPSLDIYPLAWLGMLALVWASVKDAAEEGGRRRAFWFGWAAGMLLYILSMSWVVGVMREYGGIPLALAFPVSLLLMAYMGLYVGAFSRLCAGAFARWGRWSLWLAPCWWVALEWLRRHALAGFPWNSLGLTQHRWLAMIQAADLGGVYAVSFLIVFFAGGCAYAVLRWREGSRRAAAVSLLAALALPAAALFYGHAALQWEPSDAAPIRAAAVQGNVPQGEKMLRLNAEELIERHVRLSRQAAGFQPQHIVWPESAIPLVYGDTPFYRAKVRAATKELNTYITLGTLRYEGRSLRNSTVTVDPGGKVVQRYDKMILVPFGEYVPLQKWLFFAKPLVKEVGDFGPGKWSELYPTAGGRAFGMAICYEIVFPDLIRFQVKRGASYLVTVTNDAWFGRSSAPWQHFANAALRAVETRRYVLRAANTGVSGIVDWHGRVVEQTPLFEEAVVTGTVQTSSEQTLYVRRGDWLPAACSLVTGWLVAWLAVEAGWREWRKRHPAKEEESRGGRKRR